MISEAIKAHYDKIGRKNTRRPMPYKSFGASGKMVHVTKDNEEHTIYECDLSWYLENGWKRGRKPSNKKALAHSQSAKDSSSGKGKYIVHNKLLNMVKRIYPHELEQYIKDGWERGYLNPHNKR